MGLLAFVLTLILCVVSGEYWAALSFIVGVALGEEISNKENKNV